jgi:hypothetical protein
MALKWQTRLKETLSHGNYFDARKVLFFRGSVVGGGTMLQAGRSLVQLQDEVDFFFQFT